MIVNFETAGLENLNFAFADSLIDSSCQSARTPEVSPLMESPRMYEEGEPDIVLKKDFASSVFTFIQERQNSLNLDPSLENVVDLHELISADIQAFGAEGEQINLDNIFPASDLDLAECHTSNVNQGNNILDISKFVPETVSTVCMTNSDEISRHNTNRGSSEIPTIKTEDLDLTSPLQLDCSVSQSAADSFSSCGSSRSSTPRSPVVYECRKPGRKPTAGGPIRPRKREPPKDTAEYYEKRARNNIAVRKSREKAKIKQNLTENRVQELSDENERLQKKVDLLTKELTVLKSLFINVGASLPDSFENILNS